VGVMSAVQAAKRSRVAMEMHQISLALETYKNKFGEYPPDLYDKAAVVRHVKKRWPRFQLPSRDDNDNYWALLNAIKNVYQNQNKVNLLNTYGNTFSTSSFFMNNDSASPTVHQGAQYVGALPFWLGGFPNEDGKFAGFSADPEAPFGKEYTTPTSTIVRARNNGDPTDTWTPDNIRLDTQDKDSVFYEMIIGKNVAYVTTTANIVFPALVNRDATVNKDGTTPVPYVYFKSNSSSGGNMAYTYFVSQTAAVPPVRTFEVKYYKFQSVFSNSPSYRELNIATPYAKSGDPFHPDSPTPLIWQEPERFQLIHPGLDGVFSNVSPNNVSVTLNPTTILTTDCFRSINTDAIGNTIGQKDFDNITNFSDYQQIKSILP
jgi:hypothetical protein